MEALKKKAGRLKDTVTKQQRAMIKTLSGTPSHSSTEKIIIDEDEVDRHKKLEQLYVATKAGKHYQKSIIKNVDGLVSIGIKQSENSAKLAEDASKYGEEKRIVLHGDSLEKASLHFSSYRVKLERERELFHRNLKTQVLEPLEAMVSGAPLDDARNLKQKYDKLRDEAEAVQEEIFRREHKMKEGMGNTADNVNKLKLSREKLSEIGASMDVLGKESLSAMAAVEAQQQRLTLQRLIAMVEVERSYHSKSAELLDELHALMVSERQRRDSLPVRLNSNSDLNSNSNLNSNLNQSEFDTPAKLKTNQSNLNSNRDLNALYLAEVVHEFNAEREGELSLIVGDYVIVRQDASNGWSEGEVKGKAGWFPSSFVERRQKIQASKVIETTKNF